MKQAGHRTNSGLRGLRPETPPEVRKLAAFVAALALLIGLAAVTWFQPGPGQFSAPATPVLSPRWWWTPVESDWRLRPPVTVAPLSSIAAIPGSGGKELIAVGGAGAILRTSDGGASWKVRSSSANNSLQAVTFVNRNSGWAVGDGGTILHTSDGGATWKPQASGVNRFLNSLAFVNENLGWVVGSNGVILHTSDGGATWKPQDSGSVQPLNSVAFASANSGWAVGPGGAILHTGDGGVTWKPQSSGSRQDLNSVAFVNENSGWAVGIAGTILHTNDGGATWILQNSGSDQRLLSVAFASPNSGWAVGYSGTILHTSDGGANWKTQTTSSNDSLNAVVFVNEYSGWTVGTEGAILRTSDGSTWNAQATGSRYIASLAFVNKNSGWAVGGDGAILHTSNGGATWKAQRIGSGDDLDSIAFVNESSGWAVGEGGAILHTSDGGATWKPQTSGVNQFLDSVSFVDQNSGWVVGAGGAILHTTDGGASWKAQASGFDRRLLSVAFVNENLGCATGENTVIFRTIDGGATWQKKGGSIYHLLFALAFVNENSGWAVGDGGTILHSNDGGATWKAQLTGTSQSLKSMAFVNERSGWAVGDGGTILHTSDGGATWKAQTSGSAEDLYAVAFVNENSGWAAGLGGAILHTSDGGATWKAQSLYQRWPPPLFYLLAAGAAVLLVWSSLPVRVVNRARIEEIVSSDSPVEQLDDDRLGQKALVERLTSFIRNPHTLPPLVLSLQAPWGMGKSSVMRMLQSNLKKDRAAVTVWFNAWHHQKEDQLLAYLLQAIQKEAAPSIFTPMGLRVRFDLIRVRLFAEPERFILVLAALAFLTLHAFEGWSNWTAWTGTAVSAWILAQLVVAFHSNPEKLIERSSGFVVDTLKELLTLPSLVGKTDVRQAFAASLQDVVEALKPQRLVIFLDDLDRCKPQQVVQILEAVNFLSSVAACVIVLGADYEKVETLAAMQFESIAVREEENKGVADAASQAAGLRVAYARNYLKKIVNLRLNLRLPEPKDYAGMLQEPPARPSRERKTLQRVGTLAVLAGTVMATLALVQSNKETPAAASIAHVAVQPLNSNGKNAPSGGPQTTAEQVRSAAKDTKPFDLLTPSMQAVPDRSRALLTFGIPGALLLAGLVYWFSKPRRREEAQDAESFVEALEERVGAIFERCESPREVRRFLNYLRLVATGSGTEEEGDINALRKEFGRVVDRDLVNLAAVGKTTSSGPEAAALEEYYRKQCELFGLDPWKFEPKETAAADANGRRGVMTADSP